MSSSGRLSGWVATPAVETVIRPDLRAPHDTLKSLGLYLLILEYRYETTRAIDRSERFRRVLSIAMRASFRQRASSSINHLGVANLVCFVHLEAV